MSGPDAPASTKEHAPDNAIFVEALGAGFLFSLNDERQIVRDLGAHAGVGFLPVGYRYGSSSTTRGGQATQLFVFVPVGASYLGVRAGSNALELGAGATFVYGAGFTDPSGSTTHPSLLPIGVATLGYRYQPVNRRGVMFRAGVEALVARRESFFEQFALGDVAVLPWPYLSVGASF